MMDIRGLNRINRTKQYVLSLSAVIFSSGLCYLLTPVIGYRLVGYILLISVSLLAMVFDIMPVLIAALLSALIWDFFFIPPHYTFRVGLSEDTILLLMYFVIAMVNAALTYRIRKVEKAGIVREGKENTLKLYNTLLNSLSHELRTPIATIIAATDNLKSQEAKLTAQNRYELVNEISKASIRLNQQVENLLNMSRLESGYIQARKDWVDIGEVVYETVRRLEENDVTQKITINVNPDLPLLKTDKGMLEQILYNLLNNACLYTPAQSRIDVMAMCHANVLELIVEDNGNGFPKEEVDNVFDKFYRLKHTRTGGTGLGLSIVRGFAEALDGSVTLQNTRTGGARFVVALSGEMSYLKNLKNE